MDKGRRNIIILLGLIAVGALGYFAWMYRPDTRHDWDELYRHNDDKPQPYSNEVILDLLEGYFPENRVEVLEKKRLAEALPVDTSGEANVANYVFVGRRMYLDSADRDRLLEFVERGNTALIATKRMPYQLSEKLYARDCDTLEQVEEEEWEEEDFEYEDYIELEDEEEVATDSFYVFDGDTIYYVDEDDYYEEDETDWYTDDYMPSVYQDTLVYMNFTHPKLKRDTSYTYQYVYRNKPQG